MPSPLTRPHCFAWAIFLTYSCAASAQLRDWKPLLKDMYGDSVLYLSVTGTHDDNTTASWSGTGFIINSKGFALTAAHVALGDSAYKKIVVVARARTKDNSRSWIAEVVKVDEDLDVALLKLPDASDAQQRWVPIPLGDSNEIVDGDEVLALAFANDSNSSGIEFYAGTLSTGTRRSGLISVTSTTFNPGNSGAPVFNHSLHAIGWVVGGKRDEQLRNYFAPIDFAGNVVALCGVGHTR
jgi:S1-C subfamily serine protease